MDIGEELIRLGHAVYFQDAVNGKADGDNLGSLQRMLVSHFICLPCECWSLVSTVFEWHREVKNLAVTSYYNLFCILYFSIFQPGLKFSQAILMLQNTLELQREFHVFSV